MFSVSPQETEGKLIYELGNKQWDIPQLRTLLEDILPNNVSFDNYEVDHEFSKLGRRVMLLNARRITAGEANSQKILLAIEDITERKRMENEIITSELRYRRLFETAQDGILILNAPTGEITDANPFLSDILGYSRQELLGKRLWEIGFFKDEAASRKAFKVLQDKGYIRYEDLPLKTKDGRSIQVEFVSNVYPVNGDKVMQCNIRDITERKKAEQMRDEFLGIISHELKTPLTVIMGSLLTVTDKRLPREEAEELIAESISQVDFMANLIDNLLELARQQSHRLVIQTHPVDVGDIAREIIESQRFVSSRHHILLDVPPALPPALADVTRVARILYNLVDNALKYSPKGGEIKVSVRLEEDFLVVGVTDHGPGIPHDDQAKLFQSFERLEEIGDGYISGTGIGLRVCLILVEAHGGRIWVKSKEGKGSTFFFTLPTKGA